MGTKTPVRPEGRTIPSDRLKDAPKEELREDIPKPSFRSVPMPYKNGKTAYKDVRNKELQDTGIVSYPGEPIDDTQMNQSEYPSAFAISVVFGGAVGMSAFSSLELPAGSGFLLGFGFVFTVFLALAVFNALEDRRR